MALGRLTRAADDQRLNARLLMRWAQRRLRRRYSQLIDLVLNVRTTPIEPYGPFTPIDPAVVSMRPCGWLTLLRIFRRLDIRPDDALLDIGCGAGRAVLVASLFRFRRVVGVEMAAPLLATARRNVRRSRLRRLAPIELISGDARSFVTPDDITVIFLYNPFAGEVFEAAMTQIHASFERTPRSMRLVYVNPKEHVFLAASGRWRLVGMISGPRLTRDAASTLRTHVYELTAKAPEVAHAEPDR
jgi:SAM-dependent methyltransferase